MRKILALCSAAVLASCAPSDKQAASMRTTLVPGPGSLGFEFYKDGRLAFSKYVGGVAAVYVAKSDGTNAKRITFGVWDVGPIWSPDGKWIAFSRDNGNYDVVIAPADSGAERIVAGTPANEMATAWLPDASGLLFVRNTERGSDLWIYHPADSSSAKLFDAPGLLDGYPSPDGKWIAYTKSQNGKATIWLWDREKKTHRQLTTEGFEALSYRCFSPDSRSLVYISTRSGTADIWRLDVATGERTQLTHDVAEDNAPRWSPDGSRIVFMSQRGGQPDIWVMSNGDADAQRLTNDALAKDSPDWTPDGKSVVAQVALGHQHLYALPMDGGAQVQLTSGDWDVADADISADGSRIVYSGSKNGDFDIWAVPAAGGEPHLVSGAPGFDVQAAASPDGKQVAFTSLRSGNPDIWVAATDSGPARQLTHWPSGESNARWSPDGKTIAFLSNRDAAQADIWTVPAAGGEPTRITRIGTVAVRNNNAPGTAIRWSPDSKTIAFAAQTAKSGGGAVFTVSASGGEPKQIAPAVSALPSWSPSGRELGVVQFTKGYSQVVVRDAAGTLLRTLTPEPNAYEFGLVWSRDGSQAVIQLQDLASGDGHYAVKVRPAAGGSSKNLAIQPGYSWNAQVGLTAGDKAAIDVGGPYGVALQQIAVPAPPKAP